MAGVRLIISEKTTLLIYSGPLVTKLQTMREGGSRAGRGHPDLLLT